MTQDQIIEWAREAGFGIDDAPSVMQRYKVQPLHLKIDDEITRFAALVAQHEREACTLVCEASAMRCETAAQDAIENNEPDEVSNLRSTAWQITVCAAKILARREKP